MEIRGRTAIVTGGAHGIGRAIARRLAADGARVLVVDVDDLGGPEAAAELDALGAEAASLAADVTVEADVARVVDTAGRELRDELLEPEEVAAHVAMFVADDTLAGRVLVCRGGEPARLLPPD